MLEKVVSEEINGYPAKLLMLIHVNVQFFTQVASWPVLKHYVNKPSETHLNVNFTRFCSVRSARFGIGDVSCETETIPVLVECFIEEGASLVLVLNLLIGQVFVESKNQGLGV